MIERWKITDRDEWLKRRRANVNASEIGALFGEHPYSTSYKLYHEKRGEVRPDGPDEGVLRRGRLLEDAVAKAVGEVRPEWRIEKATEYVHDSALRIGATPDFIVWCPKRGRGVLQTKTCGPMLPQMSGWGVERTGDWEEAAFPPLWIQIQTLTEQMLEDVTWGAIGALLIDGNTLPLAIREFDRHAAAEARIRAGAAAFWERFDAGQAPAPDYAADDHVIKALYPRDNGESVDLSGNNRLPGLLEQYELLDASEKSAAGALKAVKAEIAHIMGDAAAASLPGWRVTHKTQRRASYIVKESEFRVLRVKRIQQEEMAA